MRVIQFCQKIASCDAWVAAEQIGTIEKRRPLSYNLVTPALICSRISTSSAQTPSPTAADSSLLTYADSGLTLHSLRDLPCDPGPATVVTCTRVRLPSSAVLLMSPSITRPTLLVSKSWKGSVLHQPGFGYLRMTRPLSSFAVRSSSPASYRIARSTTSLLI